MNKKDLVSISQTAAFMKMCKTYTIAMLEKLKECCPLEFVVLRAPRFMKPENMINCKKEELIKVLKMLLKHFMELQLLSAHDCDIVVSQFSKMLESELKSQNIKFVEFDPAKHRLDHFYFRTIDISKYEKLAFVMQLIFTLSHGQATVERGFSIDNSVSDTNMKPETTISKRIIRDHMLAHSVKPHTIEMSSALVKSVKAAYSRYVQKMEDEKKKKQYDAKEIQKLHITEDLNKVKQKKETLEKSVSDFKQEIMECMDLAAGKKDNISIILKARTLKRASSEMSEEIKTLEVKDLEEKREKKKTCLI